MRESERRFRDLFEEAPIAYISTDRDGLITSANPQASKLFGHTSADLIGRSTFDLYADTASGIGRVRELSEQLSAGREIRNAEVELQRADGSTLWGILAVHPVMGPDGEVVASRSTVQDSTKRRAAESALRRSQANYQTLIENMDAAVSLKDVHGRYVVVNQKFADRVGTKVEQLVGRTAGEVYGREADIEEVESHDREIVESAKPVLHEGGGLGDDGGVFEVRKAPVLENKARSSELLWSQRM